MYKWGVRRLHWLHSITHARIQLTAAADALCCLATLPALPDLPAYTPDTDILWYFAAICNSCQNYLSYIYTAKLPLICYKNFGSAVILQEDGTK